MNKEEIIKLLESNRPPCIETLRGSLVEFNEEDRIMVMEFDAIPEFCHSIQIKENLVIHRKFSKRDSLKKL